MSARSVVIRGMWGDETGNSWFLYSGLVIIAQVHKNSHNNYQGSYEKQAMILIPYTGCFRSYNHPYVLGGFKTLEAAQEWCEKQLGAPL